MAAAQRAARRCRTASPLDSYDEARFGLRRAAAPECATIQAQTVRPSPPFGATAGRVTGLAASRTSSRCSPKTNARAGPAEGPRRAPTV